MSGNTEEARLVPHRGKWAIYHEGARRSTRISIADGEPGRLKAQRILDAYLKTSATAEVEESAVVDVLAAYRETKKGAPSYEKLKWNHKALSRHLGRKPPDLITPAVVAHYVTERSKEGVGGGTIRTELQDLRAALRWKLGQAAPKIALPEAPPPRSRWLTQDEADKLIEACRHRHVKLFVQIALNTAARMSAILELTWDRVDLDTRRIDFRLPGKVQSKKRRVAVPINDPLAEALADAKAKATCAYVIEFGGTRVATVKKGVWSAAKRAGIPDVSPHVFRHTAATWMLQRGAGLWDVAGVLGHSDIRMLQKTYAHHSAEYLVNTVELLAKPKPLSRFGSARASGFRGRKRQ